jgi:hypothetical protein
MMLDDIEEAQSDLNFSAQPNTAFWGPFGKARGFNLKQLSPLQTNMVHNLRTWCKENLEYASVKTANGVWTFEMCLDEGAFGWDVKVEKKGDFLAVRSTPFSRPEA